MRLLCLVSFAFTLGLDGTAAQTAEDALLELHSQVIRAHVENRPDLWMSLESADYVSVNGGSVTFPTLDERREQRSLYLSNATFTMYRDVREPIVRISEDGSLGWLIAEVQVAGELEREDGSSEVFDQVWAWVELYARTPQGWMLVGNASNSR